MRGMLPSPPASRWPGAINPGGACPVADCAPARASLSSGAMYQALRPSRSEFVPVRNLSYHVQIWGTPSADKTPLVLMHGWMDVAASYQFVVDALSHDHYVIAPDWRGYGQTHSGGVDNFWFPDYLADLDFLLDHYAPQTQVNLVGHSMGGNVV
eukprot:gene48257-64751_t